MDSTLLYGLWATSTGLALGGGWLCFYQLRQRDRYIESLLQILEAPTEHDEFEAQARVLCETCARETEALGATLYLQPGQEESGFRRAAQAGQSAEETGPGIVRDLLEQAWKSGKTAEAKHGSRHILAMPVWPGHQGGGALLLYWEQDKAPGEQSRSLLDIVAGTAALLAPRFAREGDLARVQHEMQAIQARAQEEIQSLQQELGEEFHLASVGRLAAGVAHELNTPLGAVLAMVTSLLRKEDNAGKQKRLTIMKEAVEKCKAIIQKLLVYSRAPVETEEGLTFSRFVRADTDLNQVIESTVELMREKLTQDGVKIVTDLNELPSFRANSTQMSHVFTNLMVNAGDALKQTEDPTIKIVSRTEGDKIRIEFSDNGPGVPKEIRGKLFEPFFTTKDVGHGTGLGLAICKEVIRKHHGNITIDDAPGGGALFVIEITPPRDD